MISNAIFRETIETEARRNYLVSERNYNTIKFFLENLLVIETKKVQISRNKSFYSGLSVLEVSERVMHEFGMIT